MNYIDLFAGAGGLSEGFIRNGFTPIAHVEMDSSACKTLKTRIAQYYLKENKLQDKYISYLNGDITSADLYSEVPEKLLSTVINETISNKTIKGIFDKIDRLLQGKHVEVIIGGPPCQAYSIIGRSRDPQRMQGDSRNYLFKYYAEFLSRYKPNFFIFENVTGLLTAGNYFKEMLELFKSDSIGYSVDYKILNAAHFGVLQNRKRVIIVGRRGDKKFTYPNFPTIDNTWGIKKDLFSDLPVLSPGQELNITKYCAKGSEYLHKFNIRNGVDYVSQHITRPHNERDLKIYSIAINTWLNETKRISYDELPEELKTHKNQTAFLDRYKVVNPDGLSHTLVAHIAKDGHYYIYPDKKQVRSISVREAARIQSFPDDYYFEGGRSAAFKQIGNAVPPLMAEVIARTIKELI